MECPRGAEQGGKGAWVMRAKARVPKLCEQVLVMEDMRHCSAHIFLFYLFTTSNCKGESMDWIIALDRSIIFSVIGEYAGVDRNHKIM